jgi:hypothetical protein
MAQRPCAAFLQVTEEGLRVYVRSPRDAADLIVMDHPMHRVG